MFSQRREVIETLAERRHLDRQNVEPMEQIGAEFALLAHLFEIAVRCRNHADIHFDIVIFANTEHAAVLQYAEKLRLKRCVEFSDLIEEQDATVRRPY